ncbi:hypothetical protein JAAARDRAFT_125564 [Jaapia argillacea MUCL 33604]|uniref:G-alpha-domain-containing protein n=1 Tax=Jaapia argillacea MUCL 33604 TaxID=933084 RepID=A0A067QCM8_9AGAM|nr:hypothetical protein JAAARDRAFT_125564 [Jaapia argillacea MUCL 33604]
MPPPYSSINPQDPLTLALAPPPNETDEQRQARLLAEAEAKRVSEDIDREIDQDRIARYKSSKTIKILLLGKRKSTALKNFQLMNCPNSLSSERLSWKAVIQLNIVRSIRLVLDTMSEAQSISRKSSGSSMTLSSSPTRDAHNSLSSETPALTHEQRLLKMRLAPLLEVEHVLLRRLDPDGAAGFDSPLSQLTNLPYYERSRKACKEVSFQATWAAKFSNFIRKDDRPNADMVRHMFDPDEPSQVIFACKEDMVRLWKDPTIKTLCHHQKLRLEESPGFFLNDLERVTALGYLPTDEDIMRARIKTVGIMEYRFTMASGKMLARDWRVYDVGGQRSLVTAWVPYFDDMDAIIFLAPISCFDQVLEEDPSVNRLEDSVQLWRTVISNPLLARTEIVLFLNKCDILRQKLSAGIKLAKYIVSYGNRPNDFENASAYLRRKFAHIHKHHSPENRTFYSHFTSLVVSERVQH